MNTLSTEKHPPKLLASRAMVLAILAVALLLVASGCTLLSGGDNEQDAALKETEVALGVQQTLFANSLTQESQATPTATVGQPTDTPELDATPLPPDEPTFTATSVPMTPTKSVPMITSTVNTNCRAGTSTLFRVLGILRPSDSVPVLGVSSLGYWWLIQNPENPSGECWVWMETTVVTGDTSGVPKVKPPPTPIPPDSPTPTNTAIPATEQATID
jgi:hypothetical protein